MRPTLTPARLLLALALLLAPCLAHAATLTVTSAADSGAGTLRAALAAASPGDTITFAVTGTITLTSGELEITQPITIQGPGASTLAIDGNHASRAFEIANTTGTVSLSGLTVQNGSVSSGNGGGVLVDSGAMASLTACVLTGNTATNGGGLSNGGTARVTTCLFTFNTAGAGGGIASGGPLTLTACTLAGNTATQTGGTAAEGGGGLYTSGPATLSDDILYNDSSFSGLGYEIERSGAPFVGVSYCDVNEVLVTEGITDAGHNLDANPLFVGGYPSSDPHVLPNSPVIGAGVAVPGLTTDIAGVTRANPPTIGAYEFLTVTTSTTLTSSLNPSVVGQSVTLTATVSGTGDTPGGTVTLVDPSTSPATTLATETLANGQAVFTTSGFSVGAHPIVATYAAYDIFTASASPTLTQMVQALSATILSSNLDPSTAGQAVTFTATVSGATGTPTGTVAFLDTSTTPATTLGTRTLAGGQATFTTATLSIGTHTVVAAYGGGNFAADTSGVLTQTVNPVVLHTFSAGLQVIAVTENYAGLAAAWGAPAGQTLASWSGTAYGITTALPTPGTGAWVNLAQPAALYDGGTPAAGPATLALAQGWNLVGDPFGASVALSAMTASAGGATYPLSGPQLIVYTTLYTYPAGATAYQAVGPTGSLSPFAGYWLYAFQPCTLTIPAPANG